MKKWLWFSIALVCFGPVACSSSGADAPNRQSRRGGPGGHGETAAETISVKAFRAERAPISTYILSNTTLEAIRKVTIFSKVNAIVEAIPVEEGSLVRTGELLARLDDREIKNEYSQARIALEQSEVAFEQAKVKAQLSEANFNRSKSLREQSLISQQEFDQAALTSQTDTLALQVATQAVEANRARLEGAQIQLDYTRIESSIDGVVTERMIDVGSRVSANQAVFNVEDFNPLWARIFVPERELPQLRPGVEAKLRLQAFPERDFSASIKMISPTVDPQTGTVKVTLQVEPSGRQLRPGMFGTAYIATATHPDAIVIPKRSILRERDENRVFVILSDGSVEKRAVSLGFTQEELVEVLNGVEAGEGVVTVGQEGLSDGYAVDVLAWENEGASLQVQRRPQPSTENAETDSTTGPAQAERARGAVSGGERTAGRGRPGGREGGPAAFLERMLQDPEIKKAYDEEIAKDPDFMQDPEKRRAFFSKFRGRFGQGRP